MFTSIYIRALMAEAGHVFVIRQEQIRSDKGTTTRTSFSATILCVVCVLGLLSLITAAPQSEKSKNLFAPVMQIQTSADFAQLNKTFTAKCICTAKNGKPLVNWYLPTDGSGFIHFITENNSNDTTKTTKILLLFIFKQPKSVFSIRCTCRLADSPKSLSLRNHNLKIYSAPILVSSGQHWHFGVGGTAVFNCKFTANPIGDIQWYRNDEKLDSDAIRTSINQSNAVDVQMSTLTLHGIVYDDYGLYTCLCTNQIGYAKRQFQIQNDYGRLNDKCLDHVDCFVANSFCNSQTKTCECQIGYQQPIGFEGKCIRAARLNEQCTTNQDCVNKFAHCNIDLHICECNSNFIAIKTNSSRTCYPKVEDLFHKCIFNQQCSIEGSECIDNICLCDDLHKPYWKNGSCIAKTFMYSPCTEDLCIRGGFAYSMCVNNTCQCNQGYYYNQLTHHCEGYDAFGVVLLFTFLVALIVLRFIMC